VSSGEAAINVLKGFSMYSNLTLEILEKYLIQFGENPEIILRERLGPFLRKTSADN
jgi:hypothetical protein